MTTNKVYLNGSFVPEYYASISVFDQGLLFGDGVSEDLIAYHGRVFKLHEHIDNLYENASARSLEIPMPKETLASIVLETCRSNRLDDAHIRAIVTRGAGSLTHGSKADSQPTVIVMAQPTAPGHNDTGYEKGIRLHTIRTRLMPDLFGFNVKSLSDAGKALGTLIAQNEGADEGLFLDTRGYFSRSTVCETTEGQLFVVRNKNLLTIPTGEEGILRQTMSIVATQEGLHFSVQPLTLSEVYKADEVFVASIPTRLVSVVEVDHLPIGNGNPGPVAQQLKARFDEYLQVFGEPIYTVNAISNAA